MQLAGRKLEVLLCDPKVSFPKYGLASVVAIIPPLNFLEANGVLWLAGVPTTVGSSVRLSVNARMSY